MADSPPSSLATKRTLRRRRTTFRPLPPRPLLHGGGAVAAQQLLVHRTRPLRAAEQRGHALQRVGQVRRARPRPRSRGGYGRGSATFSGALWAHSRQTPLRRAKPRNRGELSQCPAPHSRAVVSDTLASTRGGGIALPSLVGTSVLPLTTRGSAVSSTSSGRADRGGGGTEGAPPTLSGVGGWGLSQCRACPGMGTVTRACTSS